MPVERTPVSPLAEPIRSFHDILRRPNPSPDVTKAALREIMATGQQTFRTRGSILDKGLRLARKAQKRFDSLGNTETASYFERVGLACERELQELYPPENITPAEMKVLVLLSQGLSRREIARKLTKSVNTVKNSEARIFRRLGVNNRAEAAIAFYVRKYSSLNPSGSTT